MPLRHYSLRSLFIVVSAVSVACGLLAVMAPHASSDYFATYSMHTVLVLVFGMLLGVVFGRLASAIVAGIVVLLLAELVWISFHILLGASFNPSNALYNPLLLATLVTCPIAVARKRERAVILAVLLSIALPIMVCIWALYQLIKGPLPSTGLAGAAVFVIIVGTAAAILTGVLSAMIIASISPVFDGTDGTH